MPSESDLAAELEQVTQRWNQLVDVPQPPRSLMRIIEYSLGSQRRAEVYVNRLLRYLLDPEEPHGMDAEFLDAFLTGLPEACDFQEDLVDLSGVRVDDQVTVAGLDDDGSEGTGRRGDVDLVIEAPNEWLVLIELKFSAGENNLRGDGLSQTEFYAQATHVDGRPKSVYESGVYYLYVHPATEAGARADPFVDWTWGAIVDDVVEGFIVEHAPRYPQRTVTQLHDLVDDVREITGMTDHQSTEREKVELYLEHYDAITDVTEAFEARWEEFTANWPELLADTLETEGFDTTRWTFRTYQQGWGTLFRDGWWKQQRTLENISDKTDENDLRIFFHHRLRRNRDLALRDQTLAFMFRNAGANEQAFIDVFNQVFYDRRAEIEEALPDAAEVTGEKRNLIRATYDIPVDEHDDFFDAYIAALRQAFVEHAGDNDRLVALITDTYDEAIDRYR